MMQNMNITKHILIFCTIFILGVFQIKFAYSDTECASGIFSDALIQNSSAIFETDEEQIIKQWIYQTFGNKTVLSDVLKCPELIATPDTEPIKFDTIKYVFPNGREIIINYETVPRVLKQRLILANKRATPSDPNPFIGDNDNGDVWTNTDPAWYAIMVVESGALDEFVGPDKNNSVALTYIRDNIDKLYPKGFSCTSKSALAINNDAINRAVTQTVNLGDDDSNDYYVAGDINLQWIAYAEIALDVVITIATFGGGTIISGVTKATRASKSLKNLNTTIKTLRKTDTVQNYLKQVRNVNKLTDELKTIDRATDAARYADKAKELENATDALRTLENADDVKKYRDATKTYSELNKFRHSLQLKRIPQRGNVLARAARVGRATKSALSGNKLLKHAAKIGRNGAFSGRVRDWLFESTMRNIGTLAKMEAAGGIIYGITKFAADMYDYTDTETDQFTNGLEFAPLLLLSADDIAGQENIVNYGMWLMWAGNSTSSADDDAAYLQAMDFAAKFHQDLREIQNDTPSPCNVDIFVVRPILKNPGTDNTELYYLIMNDVPWTTHE